MKHRYLNVNSIWLLLIAFISFHVAQAQNTITGTITDAVTGEGLPGVNVLIKGTTTGTVTDFDGNYSLNAGEAETLVISSVGYLSQEITVGTKSVIDIRLEEDIQALDEIVVTGYGTQEKKEISSSIASVKEEDFNRGMVNDPAQLIQGKVAGLNISRVGGDPNDQASIRLRGVSTFGANQEPLVVVDGIIGVPLNSVDPSDIASIDVLKDGSAAAIYGTRGSSGVIIVTTKTGKEGVFNVDYNGSFAIDDIDRTMDFMSASEYRQVNGAVDLGSSTEWLDVVTESGVSQIHNLSMSGGMGGTSYRASVNLRDVDGIQIGTGFQRLNTRLNLTQKALNDKATFTLNMGHTATESVFGAGKSFNDGNQLGNDEDVVFRYAVVSNPTLPVLYDGTAGLTDVGGYAERDIFDYFNPKSIADQAVDEGNDLNTTVGVRFEYDFSEILNGFRTTLAYSKQWDTETRGAYIPSTLKWGDGFSNSGNAGTSTIQKNNELFEALLNWDGSFGNTDVAVLGGYSHQYFYEEGHGMFGGQFLSDAFSYHNMAASQDFNNGLGRVGSYAEEQTLIAFFGRVNVNIDNTFFLSASLRQEGSSRFGENNEWGTFPAFSGAVNLSNLFTLGTFDQLKVRASWGRTGAIPGESYLSLARLGPVGNFFFNGNYVPSYGPQSNPNPDLAWETKDEFDVGVDFSILDGRITGTMDYYTRTITDMIVEVAVPVPPNLFPLTDVNIGELKSNGFEFAIDWAAINTNSLSYNTGFNFATFNNDIESLTSGSLSFGEGGQLFTANMGSPGQNDTRLVRVKEGEPLGDLWGPVWDGQTVDANGVPVFEDLNGDGTVCDCDDDRQVVGNGLPDFSIGWNNSFTFGKGWDANVFFRGSFGHDLVNSNRGFYENTESTTVANYNIVNTKYYDPAVQKAVVNSYHVEDASFFKLDNMSIGYNFDMSNSGAISNLRAYVAGQNLFTITDYTGIDPEVRYVDEGDSGEDNNALAPGIERRNTYFTTRTFTVGVTIGF